MPLEKWQKKKKNWKTPCSFPLFSAAHPFRIEKTTPPHSWLPWAVLSYSDPSPLKPVAVNAQELINTLQGLALEKHMVRNRQFFVITVLSPFLKMPWHNFSVNKSTFFHPCAKTQLCTIKAVVLGFFFSIFHISVMALFTHRHMCIQKENADLAFLRYNSFCKLILLRASGEASSSQHRLYLLYVFLTPSQLCTVPSYGRGINSLFPALYNPYFLSSFLTLMML